MGGTSKTTQTNEPPAWATPLFTKSADVASNLYDSGKGFNTFQGSTVAKPSAATNKGIAGLMSAGQNLGGIAQNTLQQGLNAGPGAATQYLTSTAKGDYLGGNPAFMALLDKQSGALANDISTQFSGAGRYGSSAHQGTIGDKVGDFRLKGMSEDYARERGLQMQAAQAIQAGQGQDAATKLGFLGALPSAGLFGANTMLQAGSMQDAQAQAKLNDQIRKFYESDMKDWTRLGALQAAASGAAGPYGTSVTTQKQPFNPLGLFGALGSMFFPS